MLKLFRTAGDLEEVALDALIDDRLQLKEAERRGVVVTEQEVQDGMSEFAGRANLSREEFVEELANVGVEVETFEDFVRAGQAWRKVVREAFAGRISVEETAVDRAARNVPRGRPSGVAEAKSSCRQIPPNAPPRRRHAQSS